MGGDAALIAAEPAGPRRRVFFLDGAGPCLRRARLLFFTRQHT